MALPIYTRFSKPFYDGLGNPLINAEVSLRDETGNILFYNCTEIRGESGLQGCYYADVIVTRNYWIWVKPNIQSEMVCIGSWSPAFVPSIFTPSSDDFSYLIDEDGNFIEDESNNLLICDV